jgi:hypothetical protein
VSTEADKSSLLEAVTRTRLVKTLQAGKDFVFSGIICKVWKLAVVLQLFLVTTFKWSIHLIIQNPVCSHTYT